MYQVMLLDTEANIIAPDEKYLNQTCAAKIIATPLCNSVSDVMRIWHVENNGMYLVGSAYRLCIRELVDTSQLKINCA
jgi:hypothetical protein